MNKKKEKIASEYQHGIKYYKNVEQEIKKEKASK